MEPTIACRTTILCIVVGMVLTTIVIEAQQFTVEPESMVQAERLLAEFECLSPGALGHLWFVNGVESTSPDSSSEIRVAGGISGRPSVLTVPASSQFNNSVIQCAAASLSGVVFSKNATLIVERVILEVLNGETKIIVSVMNNFTMNNLTFCVDISLVPLVTNEMVALSPLNGIQNQVQFNYQQLKNYTVCDIFSFTMTPISESGMEGRSSEPVTGFFTTVTDNNNVAPLISQGGNVSRKIVHLGGMVPNCTNFISYQVTSDILAPINKTIEDPQMINVSLPTDQIINISVTLTSIMGVRLIFKAMLIRTTDVQNLSVNICPEGNCASIEYVEGTLSPGALVCVIGVLSDNSLDLESIRLLPIRRNISDHFTIPVAVSGNYSVVAFDLENNNMSVPRIPMSMVADDETMFLSNESSTELNSPPNSEGITVTRLSNGSAEVTCTTTGQSCLALFQSTTSPTSLDPMVMIGFIEPPNDRTTVTLSATSDVYVVVYTWNSDSGETIFDGKVSFISQLELPTTPPPTQSPPDTTGSPVPPAILTIVLILGGAVIVAIFIVVGILYLVKRYNRRNYKVVHSNYNHINSQGKSTNRASPKLDIGASITSQVAFYDVARPENMSIGFNTADIDDTPPPGYDVVRAENMPSPEYETVPLVQAAAKPTFTSDNPPKRKDLSISDVKHHCTEEAIGSTETQGVYTMVESVQGSEDGSSNSADYGEKKAMIAAQDVGALITSQVAFYDLARPEHMSLECITADTDDIPSPGYDVVRKENMRSTEYETIASAKAGKPTPTTSENPPTLPHPMIKEDEGLDNDVVLTEETASTAQAKDEPTEDGGDSGGYEAKIAAQHQYMLVEHKPSDKVIMKDSSKVIYSKVDKDKLKPVVPPPVAKTQGQYTLVETKPASSDAKVMDSTKVVYVMVDKEKLKPVDPNDPPALPPRRPVTNTEELHTEKTLALPPRQRPPPPPPTHETLMDLLHPVDKKWEDIANALNIDEDRVDEIFTNNENEYLRLYELMEYYFTNVHCSHSWEEMVRVLMEIGEHGLAERIKADKIQDQDAHDADSYLNAVESNNCDESTQASVRGNESKVVPPMQNDLSHPQVVDPLPIDTSNQSSVKEENDKNQLNVTKLGDNQRGGDRSMIIPPQPNYVTPSLLQDAVITVV